MSDSDRISQINDKRNELADLHARMDLDRDIYMLLPYVMYGFSKQFKNEKVDDVITVTINRAAVFADAFIATLTGAIRQPHVERLSDTKNHDIEQFATDLLYTIDESMIANKKGNSAFWLSWHVSIRGIIGMGLFLRKLEDGSYTFKPVPVDMRWCTWQDGEDGKYDWISCQTNMDSRALKSKYEKKKGVNANLIPDGKNLKVEDWWDEERNEVYVSEKKIYEAENTYGFLPYSLVFPICGAPIEDAGYIQNHWESILGLNRNLYPEFNRLASILQTIGASILFPPLKRTVVDPKSPTIDYPGGKSIVNLSQGETIDKIFTPEISQAFLQDIQMLSSALQQGGISDAELGDPGLDRSGIWFTQMNAIRQKRMLPRQNAISQMYCGLTKLAIRELKSTGQSTSMGVKKREYGALPDLDEFTIDYRMMIEDEVMDAVRATMSKGLEGTLSLYDRLKDILHHKDPDGAINRLMLERLIKENPIAYYRELSRRLVVEAKDKFEQERKDILADAELCSDLMEAEIDRMGQPEPIPGRITKVSEAPKGQGQALQGLTGMLGSQGTKQLPAPKEAINAG